jgi:hypothetical protein
MYEVLINLPELDPLLHQQLVSYLLFEFKDDVSLNVAGNALQEVHPGNYRVTKWANRDDSYNMSVYAEFASKEEYTLWFLKSHSA